MAWLKIIQFGSIWKSNTGKPNMDFEPKTVFKATKVDFQMLYHNLTDVYWSNNTDYSI